MNKLQELIQTLCPGGIEYKELQEICRYSKNRINVSEVDNTTYVGVENLLQNKQGKTLASSVPTTGNVIRFDIGDILIGNIRPYLKKIWLSDCVGGTNGDVLVVQINDRKIIIPEFLYYVLSSDAFFTYDMLYSKGTKIPRGNKVAVMQYRIPIPPLEVQKEIVHLLDEFTAKTTELQAELNKEYEARKKQYNYYRSQLLDGDSETPKMKLKNVLTIQRGKRVVKTELSKDGDYPVYQNALAPMGYYHLKNRNKDNTYLISAGAAGSIGYSTNDFWAADDCFTFECSEVLDNKFLYYSLLNKQSAINLKIRDASIPRLSRDSLEKLVISIPSLNNQKKIVEILEKFDYACSTLQSNISIELESRQKQYEYYRDKLLTFKELNESEVN